VKKSPSFFKRGKKFSSSIRRKGGTNPFLGEGGEKKENGNRRAEKASSFS